MRLTALAVALVAVGVLAAAASVPPSSAGTGTHHALGMQPCQFLVRSGIPCATCGMTTSFAHFTRGNLPASLYVQPMGTLLALVTAIVFWAALYIGITGRAAHRALRFVNTATLVWVGLGIGLAAWGWKIFIHVRGVDGW